MYVRDRLRELPVDLKLTQIPVGLPVGSELEFADELTLARALTDRREVS
jgi:recombination protein RecR